MPWPNAVPGVRLLNSLAILYGAGDPASSTVEDVTHASVGSIYVRTDGGSGSTLYVLEGPSPGNWVAK